MQPPDPHPRRRDLSAFADNELYPAAADALVRHLRDHPADAAEVRRTRDLSTAARRAVRRATPAPSDALRERVRQIAAGAARPPVAARRRPWLPWAGRLAAAVALVLGGAVAGQWAGRRASVPPAAVDVLPVGLVAHAEQVHGTCSRLALRLHAGGYPADVAGLAAAVEQDLHGPDPYPDLRPIGFAYTGAGPCGHPLAGTAHLLYHALRPGSPAAVSVFVQANRGQYGLDPGRLYAVSDDRDPYPMLAWRTDHVVYFLLADDPQTERAAADLIRTAPATRP